jgi:hypothetical protein
MTLIGEYYNEMYDHSIANQARINLEIGNVAEFTVVDTELEQTSSSKKCRNSYELGNHSITDVEEESSAPKPSENTITDVNISAQNKTVRHNKISNGKCATIACSAFVLLFVSGVLAYLFTKSTLGNTIYFNLQVHETYEILLHFGLDY